MKSLTNEVWAAPHGFEGYYEVSTHGNVRRLSRSSLKVRLIHPNRNYQPRLLTPVINNGYAYVTLTADGKKKSRRGVHIMVLEAFVELRPQGKYACHKDGNKSDNSLSNLYWGTPVENQADRVAHGRDQNGENNMSAKLTEEQVAEIVNMRKETGAAYYVIAEKFGVSKGTICNICIGKTKYKSAPKNEKLSRTGI